MDAEEEEEKDVPIQADYQQGDEHKSEDSDSFKFQVGRLPN